MTLSIEIPEINFREHQVFDLLLKNGKICDEHKDYWVYSFDFTDGIYTLVLEGVKDGELEKIEHGISSEALMNIYVENISCFAYDGDYGERIEITANAEPSFRNYYKCGNLKEFLEEVVKDSIHGSYIHGYCE